jgi:hypothetical protein
MILIIIFNLYFSTFYNIIEYATNPDDIPPFQVIYNDLTVNLIAVKDLVSTNDEQLFNNLIALKSHIFLDNIQYLILINIYSEINTFVNNLVEDNNLKNLTVKQYPPSIKDFYSKIQSISSNLEKILNEYNTHKNNINLITIDYSNKNVDYAFTNDFEIIYNDLNETLSDIRTFLNTFEYDNLVFLKSDYAINPNFFIIMVAIAAEFKQIKQLNNDNYNMKLSAVTSNISILAKNFKHYHEDIYEVIYNNPTNNNTSNSTSQINKSELFDLINDNLDKFPEIVTKDILTEQLSTVIREDDFNDKVDIILSAISNNTVY